MGEIMAIASGTWQRILKMKSVYFLILCVLALIACAYNYNILSLDCHRALMIDVSLLLNTLAAVVVALSVSFEIPREIREGIASTLITKPLGRTQYLIGKLVGTAVAGIVITGLITIGFVLVFNYFFDKATAPMIQGHILVMGSVIPMVAIGVLLSVVIPDAIAPLFTAIAIFLSFSITKLGKIQFLYGGILPDLNLFNMRAEAAYEIPVDFSYIVLVLIWGIVFSTFATSVASLIFSQKDLK